MDKINISLDRQRLDIDLIYNFLKTAYWAKGRSKTMVRNTINNSICFGVYIGEKQIGFARVVSDRVVFAYLMDVFIIPEFRRKGHGSALIDFILKEPQLRDVQNWMLATSDAHKLYQKFGFNSLEFPNKIMKKTNS